MSLCCAQATTVNLLETQCSFIQLLLHLVVLINVYLFEAVEEVQKDSVVFKCTACSAS